LESDEVAGQSATGTSYKKVVYSVKLALSKIV